MPAWSHTPIRQKLAGCHFAVILLFLIGGCATNYPAPYRFAEEHRTLSRHLGNQPLPSYETTPGIPEFRNIAPLPPETATGYDQTPLRCSAIGRALEGRIEHFLMVAIPFVIPNPYLRTPLMLAAPYIEDAILDLADWLWAEPLAGGV